MKDIKAYIRESILDDIDVQLNDDSFIMKHAFVDWMCDNCNAHRPRVEAIAELDAKTKKLNYNDYNGINVTDKAEPMPEFIKIGFCSSLSLGDCQEFFDKCKSQLPDAVEDLSIYDIAIKDFTIQAEYAYLKRAKEIKRLTITVPERRRGLRTNHFPMYLPDGDSMSETTFNGKNGILVNVSETDIAEEFIKKIKKEVSAFKKKHHNVSYRDIDRIIMDVAGEVLPLEHISKNWKGVQRIVFKDKGGVLMEGYEYEGSSLKLGDLYLERSYNGTGMWTPIHRLYRD